MPHSYHLKIKYLIIIVAVLIQTVIIYLPSPKTDNPDVKSAIRRAKTEVCKQELANFASKLSHFVGQKQVQLKRSCKLDLPEQPILRVGCILPGSSEIIKLEDQVISESSCLDLCFSSGHAYGGYNKNSKRCFCGDNAHEFSFNETCSSKDELDWYRVNNGIYYPSQSSSKSVHNNSRFSRKIRIAFLLTLSGRNTLHIKRLLENIYSEDNLYYLHVDKRDDKLFDSLQVLKKTYRNVILAPERFETIWGGPNLLTMIFNAMIHLSSFEWNYLINLSESDFPIKPLSVLTSYLSSNDNLIYLKSHNIKGYNFIKKQGLNRNFYQCEGRAWRMGKRELPSGLVYSGGSDWFALPRDFCNYITEQSSNSSSLVGPLLQTYNYTLLPAESFFHTLALNSEFCDRVIDNNLRITNWHRRQGCKCQHKDVVDWCGCSPQVYRLSDWPKLKLTNSSNNLFFSRKFDPTISSSIIAAVESQLVRRNPPNQLSDYDTRYWQNAFTRNELYSQRGKVLEQFGLFSLKQVEPFLTLKQVKSLKLIKADLFFNRDRFVGLVYHFCEPSGCIQLLVERNTEAPLHPCKNYSSNLLGDHSLEVIEVSHGFDAGERLFRDYRPLSHQSKIVVYHEWLINRQKDLDRISANGLTFSWFNPKNQLELIQNVKFKNTTEPTRISLAHRLDIRKQLHSGLWTLTIAHRDLDCISYKFLVFDQYAFDEKRIELEQFNKFYVVSGLCSVTNNSKASDSCSKSHWSLLSKGTIPS